MRVSRERNLIYNQIESNLPSDNSRVSKAVRYAVFPSNKGHL